MAAFRLSPRVLWTLLAAAAATAALAAAGPASAGIAPDLARRIIAAPPDAVFPVIVTLERQVDPERFRGRPHVLLRELRRQARAAQAPVEARVGDALEGEVRRFWLVDALAGEATREGVVALASDPAVAEVALDHPVRLADEDDELLLEEEPVGDWGVQDVHAPEVWSTTGITGAGVRVGSIDTGVNAANPAIAGKIAAWRDFVNGRAAAYDDNGHGTHTIGTMVGGNSAAPIGVAPGATAVVAKALAADGTGSGVTLLEAAQWMTDPDGNPATRDYPAVINNSWTAGDPNNTWFRQMVKTWVALGIVPVFAAGNTGPSAGTVGNPGSYPESLAVGALMGDGTVAPFSARGPVVWEDVDGDGPPAGTTLVKPDLTAPGWGIVSASLNGLSSESGTSMAAPHVAGIAALVHQANPKLPAPAIAEILRSTATDLGPAGPDFDYGHGEVNAAAAVSAALRAAGAPDTAIVAGPPPVTAQTTVTYQVAVSGADRVRARVDGGPWGAPVPAPVVSVTLPSGRHQVELQAVGANGATDPTPAAAQVTVDAEPPAVSFRWSRKGKAMVLQATATDALAGIDAGSFRWDLGRGRTATGPRVTRVFPGKKPTRVRLSVGDLAGNVATHSAAVPTAAAVLAALRRPTPLRSVRLSARSSATGSWRLVVRGRTVAAARVRAEIRPVGKIHIESSLPPARQVRRKRAGGFSVVLPLTAVFPGRYRVVVRAETGSGLQIGKAVVRTFTVR